MWIGPSFFPFEYSFVPFPFHLRLRCVSRVRPRPVVVLPGFDLRSNPRFSSCVSIGSLRFIQCQTKSHRIGGARERERRRESINVTIRYDRVMTWSQFRTFFPAEWGKYDTVQSLVQTEGDPRPKSWRDVSWDLSGMLRLCVVVVHFGTSDLLCTSMLQVGLDVLRSQIASLWKNQTKRTAAAAALNVFHFISGTSLPFCVSTCTVQWHSATSTSCQLLLVSGQRRRIKSSLLLNRAGFTLRRRAAFFFFILPFSVFFASDLFFLLNPEFRPRYSYGIVVAQLEGRRSMHV